MENVSNFLKNYCKIVIRYFLLEAIEKYGVLTGEIPRRGRLESFSTKHLKDKIEEKKSPAHEHIFTRISSINVDKLSKDDPLCIGIIDLSSDKYNISEIPRWRED